MIQGVDVALPWQFRIQGSKLYIHRLLSNPFFLVLNISMLAFAVIYAGTRVNIIILIFKLKNVNA